MIIFRCDFFRAAPAEAERQPFFASFEGRLK
jgi:hypothetical protein